MTPQKKLPKKFYSYSVTIKKFSQNISFRIFMYYNFWFLTPRTFLIFGFYYIHNIFRIFSVSGLTAKSMYCCVERSNGRC